MDGGPVLGNRIYRYDWNAATGTLINPQLILDLQVGLNHNGGVLVWDDANNHLYGVVGDLAHGGQLQNNAFSNPPDDTSVIVRINADGTPRRATRIRPTATT